MQQDRGGVVGGGDRLHQNQVAPPQKCPRCESMNTKFCYYNNYSLAQPRYYCKGCRRYWTHGGTLRNIPVGGGFRKGKRPRISSSSTSSSSGGGSSIGPLVPHQPLTSMTTQHPNMTIFPPPTPAPTTSRISPYYQGNANQGFFSSLAPLQNLNNSSFNQHLDQTSLLGGGSSLNLGGMPLTEFNIVPSRGFAASEFHNYTESLNNDNQISTRPAASDNWFINNSSTTANLAISYPTTWTITTTTSVPNTNPSTAAMADHGRSTSLGRAQWTHDQFQLPGDGPP
ncbi:hypothetical protein ACFE04_020103 [Oxalis oulophora]